MVLFSAMLLHSGGNFIGALPADMKRFLERDDLMANTEKDIYFALERWYKFDKNGRYI